MIAVLSPSLRAYSYQGRVIVGALVADEHSTTGLALIPLGAGETLDEAKLAASNMVAIMAQRIARIAEVGADVSNAAPPVN